MNAKKESQGRFWMLLPALLLGGSVLGWIVMVRAAVLDPSFATEPNYYKKAVRFDQDREEQAASDALGWQLSVETFVRAGEVSTLRVAVRDKNGIPVSGLTGEALGFPNSRAMNVSNFAFRERDAGSYEATSPGGRLGLWELRLSFEKEGKKLLRVERVDLTVVPGGA